jgi:hypothetical protein
MPIQALGSYQLFRQIGVNLSQVPFILFLLAGFQIKHFICDGPLQTLGMVLAKSHYGRPLGLLHAAIHGAGTLVVFLLAGIAAAPVLALADFVIHYHVDFSKENVVKAMGWNPSKGPFWWALSADQGLHQLTYLGLVWYSLTP